MTKIVSLLVLIQSHMEESRFRLRKDLLIAYIEISPEIESRSGDAILIEKRFLSQITLDVSNWGSDI